MERYLACSIQRTLRKTTGNSLLKYVLRKAVPADQTRIEELFIEMLQTIYQRTDVDGYEDGYLEKFFQNTGDWVCVAESEGHVIAFLSIEEHHEESDYIYLDDFSVGEGYRGCGIGTSLIETAVQYARDREISFLILHVEKSNIRAHKLYEQIGFQDFKDEGNRIKMRMIL